MIAQKKGRGAQINTHNRFDSTASFMFWEDAQHDPEILEQDKSTEFIQVHAKTIVNKVDSPDVPAAWSINPYQGCEHGCVYCYARVTHEYWGYSAGTDFESKILYKPDAAELLKKKLSSKHWTPSPIMLSGNTDCYQPAEKQLKITRSLLQVFLDHRHPVGIITKNALICRDIDILTKLAEKNLVHVHISLTSLNEELRRNMEPRTASVKNRLKTIKTLSDAGIPVSVMFAPVVPGLNSDEVFDVAEAVKEAGAISMSYTMVRLNGSIALIFEDWLRKTYPLKANRVLNLISAAQGGNLSNHNFGERMKGKGVFAESVRQQIQLARKRYKLDGKMPAFNLNLYRANANGQLNLF
ncbi:PA0069 family radical SAM protein [bacterium]|nr:PA0069 family radical SAM protein [bacterium]